MNFSYNSTQQMLHDSAETFAREHADFERRRALMGSASGYSDDDWQLMAELGWLAALMPEEYDGIDGGPIVAMILMEALGKSLAKEPFFSTAVLGAGTIIRHGQPQQQQQWLPQIALGRLRMAWAHNEASAQYNKYHVSLTATSQGANYVLRGTKRNALDAPTADVLLVSARTAGNVGERDGITLFAIDARHPNIRQQSFTRLDGGRASHLELNGVEVSPDAIIGAVDQGSDIIDDVYQHAIGALAGEALGSMQIMHDDTLDYLKIRHQFGKAIGSFQALQHRQVDMYTALEEARSLTQAANMALADGLPQAPRLLAMAKVQLGRSAKLVGQSAIQLHGGIGMTDELRVGAHFKRLTVINALFGSAAHHLEQLAGTPED